MNVIYVIMLIYRCNMVRICIDFFFILLFFGENLVYIILVIFVVLEFGLFKDLIMIMYGWY